MDKDDLLYIIQRAGYSSQEAKEYLDRCLALRCLELQRLATFQDLEPSQQDDLIKLLIMIRDD